MANRPVRVLRLLEYTYSDSEIAADDIQRWSVPAQGKITVPKGTEHSVVIRSMIIVQPFEETETAATIERVMMATAPDGGLKVGDTSDPGGIPFSQQAAAFARSRERSDD